MKKEKVLARLKEDCLVAVIRAKNYEQGEKVVDAVIAGGINLIELTMTMDGTYQATSQKPNTQPPAGAQIVDLLGDVEGR